MNINTKPVLVEFRLVGRIRAVSIISPKKTPNVQELETYRRI